MQGIPLNALLDTGATRSLISKRLWEQLKTPHRLLQPHPSKPSRLHHVSIDRVQVVPDDVAWSDINPRPRHNRKGPDVRRTIVVPLSTPQPCPDNPNDESDNEEDANSVTSSEASSLDNGPANDQAEIPDQGPRAKQYKAQGRHKLKARRTLPPTRWQPPRAAKKRSRDSDSSDADEQVDSRPRIASLRCRGPFY